MGIITFIGMILALAGVVSGIIMLGGDIMDFIDAPSALTTIFPTIAALAAAMPLSVFTKFPAHMAVILRKPYSPEAYINLLADLAKKARSEGLLSLEQTIAETKEPFMQYGLRLVIDGVDDTNIKYYLESNLEGLNSRHSEAASMYDKAAAFAPAFGMCATVIGLVNMLGNLDLSDPAAINSIGGNMSMALITTLYGSLFANVIFTPIASKLRALHKSEVFCKVMIADGILAIQRGDNPNIMKEALLEQLSSKQKKLVGESGAKGETAS